MKLLILVITLLSLTGCASAGKFMQDFSQGMKNNDSRQEDTNKTCQLSNYGGGNSYNMYCY